MDSLLYTACDLQTLNFVVSNQSLSLHIGTYLIPGNISSSPVVVNQYQTQMTPTLVCKVIGVDEMGIDDLIEIFPNPTTDKLTIEINSSYIQKISICNLTGKLIKTISCNNSNLEIDVSNLSPGIYFLNGTSDQGTFRKRFVKN
ncbi:MAG: T9SS type A sorting domain-containing protein [Bacteroidetes bacterium]|nr:T9SS type A sorting domain-containing protein [Bacteroidota bacterium]